MAVCKNSRGDSDSPETVDDGFFDYDLQKSASIFIASKIEIFGQGSFFLTVLHIKGTTIPQKG